LIFRNPANPLTKLLNPIFDSSSDSRLYVPLSIRDLELTDRLSFNRTSQTHSESNLGKEEPIMKISFDSCISEVGFARKSLNFRARYNDKLNKIVDTIYPIEKQDLKNRNKLESYLKTCLEFANVQTNEIGTNSNLQKVASFMFEHGMYSHPSFYQKDLLKNLLIMQTDEIKIQSHLSFIDKVAQEFEKQFMAVKFDQLKQIFLLIRHHYVPFYDTPEMNFQAGIPSIVFPFKYFLAHSFEPNCILRPYYDSIGDKEHLVLKTLKPISVGETLTINYENKR
jgi:hypothetical protein